MRNATTCSGNSHGIDMAYRQRPARKGRLPNLQSSQPTCSSVTTCRNQSCPRTPPTEGAASAGDDINSQGTAGNAAAATCSCGSPMQCKKRPFGLRNGAILNTGRRLRRRKEAGVCFKATSPSGCSSPCYISPFHVNYRSQIIADPSYQPMHPAQLMLDHSLSLRK